MLLYYSYVTQGIVTYPHIHRLFHHIVVSCALIVQFEIFLTPNVNALRSLSDLRYLEALVYCGGEKSRR